MMKEEKKALRKQMAHLKGSMNASDLLCCSEKLFGHLEDSKRFREAHTVLCYYSLPDEVYKHDFVERWKNDKHILLPVVKGNDLELRCYTGKQDLRIGAYHIEEPTGKLFTDYASIELVLVPGVSFDAEGNRLGRGKGYYDRLLPQLSSSCNVGICFGFQVSEKVPCEPFDCQMDAVLTENGWIKE